MSYLLDRQTQDGDSDKINFLNGVAHRRHHKRVRRFPWAKFFDGDLYRQEGYGHSPCVHPVYASGCF
ncbi:hypothetical protein CSQ89_16495 [Chitinimonas sp. BJB300]|nr:hypothetical protein CSQ89_16495 [Chitinimonas sp. BJB300]